MRSKLIHFWFLVYCNHDHSHEDVKRAILLKNPGVLSWTKNTWHLPSFARQHVTTDPLERVIGLQYSMGSICAFVEEEETLSEISFAISMDVSPVVSSFSDESLVSIISDNSLDTTMTPPSPTRTIVTVYPVIVMRDWVWCCLLYGNRIISVFDGGNICAMHNCCAFQDSPNQDGLFARCNEIKWFSCFNLHQNSLDHGSLSFLNYTVFLCSLTLHSLMPRMATCPYHPIEFHFDTFVLQRQLWRHQNGMWSLSVRNESSSSGGSSGYVAWSCAECGTNFIWNRKGNNAVPVIQQLGIHAVWRHSMAWQEVWSRLAPPALVW